jgi:hypothetical protein
MVRKSVVLLLVCLVASALTSSVKIAEAQDVVECDLYMDTECTVDAGQELVIGHWWGACRPGLIKAFLRAIGEQEYTLNGAPLWDTQEASQYWGPIEEYADEWAMERCMSQPSTFYWIHWAHELDLEPGEYDLGFTLWLAHPNVDGGDWDGDGRPDKYTGQLYDLTVPIHVLSD